MYEITYKTNSGDKKVIELSGAQFDSFYAIYKKTSLKELIQVPKTNEWIQKMNIENFEQKTVVKKQNNFIYVQTRFEKEPPPQKDLQCIKAYVWNKHFEKLKKTEKVDAKEFAHMSCCFSENQIQKWFWSMVKSVWNWENERTEEIIYEGHEFIISGKFGDKQIFNS